MDALLAAAARRCSRPPSRCGARRSPGSRSSRSCSRWRWCVLQHPRQSARLAARDRQLAALLRACSGTAGCTATRACRSSSRSSRCGAGGSGCAAPRPTAARSRCAASARAGAGSRSAALALAWPATGLFLARYTDTDVPWWDAFPTAAQRGRPVAARPQVHRELADLGRRQRRQRRRCSPTRACG